MFGFKIVREKDLAELMKSKDFEAYLGSIDLLEREKAELKDEAQGKLRKLLRELGEVKRLNQDAARAIRELAARNDALKKELKRVTRKCKRLERSKLKLRRVV